MVLKNDLKEEQICKVLNTASRTVGVMHFSRYPEKCRSPYCPNSIIKARYSLCICRSSRLLLLHQARGPPPPLEFQKFKESGEKVKEYWKSDYALNKKSLGIVYQFADGVVEVTLEDYIRENPGKTADDFLAFKAISDDLYAAQERELHATTYRDIPLHCCKGVCVPSTEEVWEQMLTHRELEKLRHQLLRFLRSGLLTKTQQRRFHLYCIKGLSTRQIAVAEGVRQYAVWKSLALCQKKFQKFLSDRVVTPPDFLQ